MRSSMGGCVANRRETSCGRNGFAMNVWLWSGLSRQTFYVGLGWLALGFCQLLWLTRGFTRPAPTLSMN